MLDISEAVQLTSGSGASTTPAGLPRRGPRSALGSVLIDPPWRLLVWPSASNADRRIREPVAAGSRLSLMLILHAPGRLCIRSCIYHRSASTADIYKEFIGMMLRKPRTYLTARFLFCALSFSFLL